MNKLEEIVNSAEGETKKAMEELVHSLAEKIRENDRLSQHVDYLKHDIKLLKKKIYGTSSEKLNDQDIRSQDNLFNEFELCSQEIEIEEPALPEETTNPKSHKKSGRKSLPKTISRKIIEHDLPESEKKCRCGNPMECIGAQVSEELEYQPTTFTVIEHHCKKYACSTCRQENKKTDSQLVSLKTAKKPNKLIPKSYATPSLLAAIIIAKFCDHLPLYRLEGIFKRESIHLSRQTMSLWVLKVSDAIIPLVNLLQDSLLNYDVSFADETTLQVLNEPGRTAKTKSYIWCFVGGPPDQRKIIYQYHPTRSASIPEVFFEGYEGAIHCDGYHGYNNLIASKTITGINCMSHVRRKFLEALPNGKEKGVSGYVVKILRVLYKIESDLKDQNAPMNTIRSVRQEKSKPLLESLKVYLEEKKTMVPLSSPVGKAIKYALKRWNYLLTYLDDGRYEIDNNRCERAIKPFVMGRKAWLFANTTLGAHASARLFTLIETAKANHIEPRAYLEYIFKALPNCHSVEAYEALLPWALKEKLPQFN